MDTTNIILTILHTNGGWMSEKDIQRNPSPKIRQDAIGKTLKTLLKRGHVEEKTIVVGKKKKKKNVVQYRAVDGAKDIVFSR